jgi:hypothetical protein
VQPGVPRSDCVEGERAVCSLAFIIQDDAISSEREKEDTKSGRGMR